MEDSIRHKRELGRLGEDIACDWLSAHGHTVLRRNYRSGHLEIDIVSIDKDGIHFVEVKSRKTPFEAEPQDCVTTPKQRKVTKAAAAYLALGLPDTISETECFFDVAAVVFDNGETDVRYFPEAYLPIYK